jgi:signal transduction histidine kinase
MKSPAFGYPVAILLIVLIVLLKPSLDQWLGPALSLTYFIPVVTISAWYGGRGPGLFTTALGALICAYFFLEPSGSFLEAFQNERFRLLIFMINGILISILMGELHHAWRLSEERASEAKQSLVQLNTAQQRAVQAERLAAIGQMMTGLAHESRNALQRGQACLEMLALRINSRPDALDLLGGAQEAQDDLHRLYEEVCSYASPFALEPRICSLHEVVQETWDRLEPARRGRDARLDEHGDYQLTLLADRFRLVQVFRNIFDNALAASTDPVSVSVSWHEFDTPDTHMVRISVRDRGPGLSPEQKTKLFEPFYTTKTHGTGLGMPIARRIIEAHGGTIELGPNSAPGTEILITVPRGLT